MAITNFVIGDPAEKVKTAPRCWGTGAPVLADALVSDVKRFPVGTQYVDLASRIIYHRSAVAGVLADYFASAAGTQLT